MLKKSNEHSLGEMLKQISRSKNVEPGYNEYRIKKWWKETMGSMINDNTSRIFLKGTTLFIGVDSASLRSELNMNKQELKEKINELLGNTAVENIIVQ